MMLFLAHAIEDAERIKALYERLSEEGYDPWLPEINILPGQNRQTEIDNAIRRSDRFIGCLSAHSVSEHGHLHKELRLALTTYAEKPPTKSYLILLRLDDCKIPDLRVPELGISLRDVQCLDYWKPDSYERLLQAIDSSEGFTANILPPSDAPSSSSIPSAQGFIGRERELDHLSREYTNGARVFIFHGLGGSGKTALAQEFATRIKHEYASNIYLDLQGVSKEPLLPGEAILQIVKEFYPNTPDGLNPQKLESRYVSCLNEHNLLILFDNAKDDTQIAPLNKSNNSCLLITSRESCFLVGAIVTRVDQLTTKDTRKLLFSIADEERFGGYADELARLAGYLPMALLPLGALLKKNETISATDLVRVYQDRQHRLLLARPEYRNNITVYASFDLSYELLSEDLKKYWRQLAVFQTDFHNGGPGYVWGVELRDQIDSILTQLCQRNLLNFLPETQRYYSHDLAADFLTQKLIDANELEEAGYRHAQFYFFVLEKASMFVEGENYEAAWCYFDGERNNIDAGRHWASAFANRDEASAKLHQAYTSYDPEIVTSGMHPRKLLQLQRTAVEAARHSNNGPLETNALKDLALTYRGLGEYDNAFRTIHQALRRAQKDRNKGLECEILSTMGLFYCDFGSSRKSFMYHDRALEILDGLADPLLQSKLLLNLGIAHRRISPRGAVDFFERALEISKAINRPLEVASCFSNLGKTYLDLSNFDKAVFYLERALQIFRGGRDIERQGICLGDLGVAHVCAGDNDLGLPLIRKSISMLEEIDSPDAASFRLELSRFTQPLILLGEPRRSVRD